MRIQQHSEGQLVECWTNSEPLNFSGLLEVDLLGLRVIRSCERLAEVQSWLELDDALSQ
jgi:hypothetical protein